VVEQLRVNKIMNNDIVCFMCLFNCYNFLAAVRLGRQDLWLVLGVRWLFGRLANALDYEVQANN